MTLIEWIITIAITTMLIGGTLVIGTRFVTLRDRLTAENTELSLYLAHAIATSSRSDQWVSVNGGALASTFSRLSLPWNSDLSINGTQKLGFTAAGTTKYSGSATIGDHYKVSLGINVGRPNLTVTLP